VVSVSGDGTSQDPRMDKIGGVTDHARTVPVSAGKRRSMPVVEEAIWPKSRLMSADDALMRKESRNVSEHRRLTEHW
jgi:hypothetical protein